MRIEIVRKKWVFILIYFFFVLFHHFDVIAMEANQSQILESFNVSPDYVQKALNAGLILFMIFLLVWGVSFDHFSRKRLLALGGIIWATTSWLTGIAPTFVTFGVSLAISALDDASTVGIFSLIADEYSPRNRGKILGLVQATQPLAFLVALMFTTTHPLNLDWRTGLMLSGGIGLVMAVLVLIGIKEPKRGQSEPALKGIKLSGEYLFDWEIAKDMLKKPSFILLCGVGFFLMMPWIALSNGLLAQIQTGWAISAEDSYLVLLPALVALTLGHPMGGLIGDFFFKMKRRGRVIANIGVIALTMVFLILTFQIRDAQGLAFRMSLALTGLFMGMSRPNIISMTFDMALPEIRSSSLSVILFFQFVGILAGQGLVIALSARVGLVPATLWVSLGSWGISLALLIELLFKMPREIEDQRRHLAYRSQLEARMAVRK